MNAVISAVWPTAAASQHINFSITCVVEKLYAFEETGLEGEDHCIHCITAAGLGGGGGGTEAAGGDRSGWRSARPTRSSSNAKLSPG